MGRLLTILFIVLVMGGFACRNDSISPPDGIPPGKRDYTWSIDSVDYENLPSIIQLESIWGSSSVDVWGAAGDAPDVRDCLWHYNGVKWSRATAGTPITEFTGNKTVYAVWGSARTDVWAVGRKINYGMLSAFLMHYDGTRWTDATPRNVSALSSILYNIYGVTNNNIWVGGEEYALNYDGGFWKAYKIADSVIVNSTTSNSKKVYLDTYSPWGKDSVFVYSLSNNTIEQIDHSTRSHSKFGSGLWATDTRLISFANGIISSKLNSDGILDTMSWNREFTTPTYFRNRFIQSEKNVFAVGVWNLIYHYNGIDWKQILISVTNHTVDSHSDFWGVWTDGGEVFICDWQNGIVYNGR